MSYLNRLKVFMAALPYELENKTEEHFQTIIQGCLPAVKYVIFCWRTKKLCAVHPNCHYPLILFRIAYFHFYQR